MNFKAIFFDLDGTLIDSVEDIADSVNSVLEREGFSNHPTEKYYKFVGNGMKTLVQRALPQDVNDEVVTEVLQKVKQQYDVSWNKKTHLYPKIDELLERLKDENVLIGILSNKPHQFTQKVVNEYFAKWNFHFTTGSIEEFPLKPDPALALHIAKEHNLDPTSIIYVGDSDVDMKTAVNAGFFPVGVSWGFRGAKELWDNGAKKVVDNPLEILDILGSGR